MAYQISYNNDRDKFFIEERNSFFISYNRIIVTKLHIGFDEYQKIMEENFNATAIREISTSFSAIIIVFSDYADAAKALEWIESMILARKLVQ